MCHSRRCSAEKSLSFCHLTKQRLINELGDGVHERHGWHDDSLTYDLPKFRVFTKKAHSDRRLAPALYTGLLIFHSYPLLLSMIHISKYLILQAKPPPW